MTHSSGSSQVTISWEGGCTSCSCTAGFCLVSLMLSKADHTIPSTPPVGQEHEQFTIHLPYRLPMSSGFPGWDTHVTQLLLRLCCVIVDAFSSGMKSTWMNGCICSWANRKLRFCKHHSSRVFQRLLGNQRVDLILPLLAIKDLVDCGLILMSDNNAWMRKHVWWKCLHNKLKYTILFYSPITSPNVSKFNFLTFSRLYFTPPSISPCIKVILCLLPQLHSRGSLDVPT